MALIRVWLFFISCLVHVTFQQQYQVPEATVQLLNPIGFSVSIPDEEGVRLFAFHGKINEEFESTSDGGYFSKDVTKAKNNRWTFIDTDTRFKLGDTLNYWLFVDYFDGRNKLGYVSEFRRFTVTECPSKKVDEKGFCAGRDPSQFEVPDATVEILQPRGFTVSIPDQEGIKLFAFHGKINKEFDGREGGTFSKDITSPSNGKWTFRDTETRLKPGDIIYYWLNVHYKNNEGNVLGYLKEDQKYVVSGSTEAPGQCTKSVTTWNGRETCSGQLLLDEEFAFLNVNNWTREIMYADEPDYEFVIYDKYGENLYIQNNELHIKPTLADDKYGEQFVYQTTDYDLGSSCTSDKPINCKRRSAGGYGLPPVFSARIGSNNFFKYGRVDIRAKLPTGDWIYPQLFLTPKRNEYGSESYDSGEIRIAFVSGNADLNGVLQGMISLGTSATAREFGIRKLRKYNEGWSDNYHTFSVIWTPDSLTFIVDNTEYAKVVPPAGGFAGQFLQEKPEAAAKWKSGNQMAPFDKEMFIKLGVGVGGHTFPDNIPGKMYTNLEPKGQDKFYNKKDVWKRTWTRDSELIIDYVKVFAL